MEKDIIGTMGIAELIESQASGSISCSGIADAILSRTRKSGHQNLRAFITINSHLAADAAEIDRRARQGVPMLLRGIPIALKDNIDTSDMPTSAGALILRDFRPERDATVVTRIRAAGALIVGKTNMDELAVAGVGLSSLGGQTLNPWDPTRGAAGSSSGSAVAVATGMAVAALGTETVNSIRNPANVMGVVGIRPSRGLVSRAGVLPLSPTMDVVGPIARTVTDAALVLRAIISRDRADPATAASQNFDHDAIARVDSPGLAGFRVGVVRRLFGTEAEHQPIGAIIDAALSRASEFGLDVVEIGDSELDTERLSSLLNVSNWEFRGAFEAYLDSHGDRAPIRTLADYVGDGRFVAATMGTYLENALRRDAAQEDGGYWESLGHIARLRARMVAIFTERRLDAMAYPAMKRAAHHLGEHRRPDRNGVLASALGFPAINLPVGMLPSNEAAPHGLPVGIDLMGLPLGDANLLDLASAIEARVGGCQVYPLFC